MTEHAKSFSSIGSVVGVIAALLLSSATSMYTTVFILLIIVFHNYYYNLLQESVSDYYYELSTHDVMVSTLSTMCIVLIELILFLAVYSVLVCNMWILDTVYFSILVAHDGQEEECSQVQVTG